MRLTVYLCDYCGPAPGLDMKLDLYARGMLILQGGTTLGEKGWHRATKAHGGRIKHRCDLCRKAIREETIRSSRGTNS